MNETVVHKSVIMEWNCYELKSIHSKWQKVKFSFLMKLLRTKMSARDFVQGQDKRWIYRDLTKKMMQNVSKQDEVTLSFRLDGFNVGLCWSWRGEWRTKFDNRENSYQQKTFAGLPNNFSFFLFKNFIKQLLVVFLFKKLFRVKRLIIATKFCITAL